MGIKIKNEQSDGVEKQMSDIHYEKEQKKKNPGFLLSAVSSNSGKTAAACGLMSAFLQRGKCVRACKCGPDYIDPMFHREVLGVDSKNLDLFFSDREELRAGYLRHTQGADLTITEGVMGFYDGMALDSAKASSYDVARTLGLPVILVIHARGAALTLASVVQGVAEFQPDSNIRGILLNRVSGMLYPRLKSMLETELQRTGHGEIRVVGYMPEDEAFHLESRHLGLVTPQELDNLQEKVKQAGKIFAETVDLELLETIAGEADIVGQGEKVLLQMAISGEEKTDTGVEKLQEEPVLAGSEKKKDLCERSQSVQNEWKVKEAGGSVITGKKEKPVRIAVARDEAFCFYYKDNLEFLEHMGCELVEFSPLRDEKLPEKISGLILGGGYPELYGKQLSENRSMLESVRTALKQKMPCLAECGGFMYLHEEMEDAQGNVWDLVGRIKGRTSPKGKLVRFGYVNVMMNAQMHASISGNASRKEELTKIPLSDVEQEEVQISAEYLSTDGGKWLLPGEVIRAHEFHYWDSTDSGSACIAVKPDGKRNWECMHLEENLAAGYPHFYYPSCPGFAERFVENCKQQCQSAE